MNRLFVQIAMAVGLFIVVSPIWSATLYVATDGDNGMPGNFNSCQNPNAPCRSVFWVLLFVNDGDTIQLAPGIYTETINIPSVANPVSSLSLVGELDDNGEIAVIIRAHENPGQASERVIGIFDTDMEMEISNMVIANGRALADDSTEEARGGGVMNSGADLKIHNVRFEGNEADFWGGGLFSRGPLELENVWFLGNSVVSAQPGGSGELLHGGGGLFHSSTGGAVTLTGVYLTGNAVNDPGRGGGAAIHRDANLERVTFIDNQAYRGGGLYSVDRPVTLRDVIFKGNQATTRGGGAYLVRAASVQINVEFAGNFAATGGALTVRAAAAELVNVTIAGN